MVNSVGRAVQLVQHLNLQRPFTFVSLPMNFLESTFLDWKVTLEPIAAKKPPQLNVASVTDAMATPPTMGNRDRTMGIVGVSPRKAADSATLKKGSSACQEASVLYEAGSTVIMTAG